MKRRPIPWVVATLLSVTFLCQACKDPDTPKPDEKFYCKVDGKHWRPDSDGDFKAHTLISDLTYEGKYLRIHATDAKNRQSIIISFADSSGIDTTQLSKTYKISLKYFFPNNPPAGYFYKPVSQNSVRDIEYTTNTTHKGTFRILSVEHDRRVLNSFKMKAEFEFSAVSPSGEVVRISDGRFYDWVRISQ